jgi:hypothetical protein
MPRPEGHFGRSRFRFPRAALGVVLALAGLVVASPLAAQAESLPGGASERGPGPVPEVPAALRVPEGQALLFRLFAQGTQIYDCRESGAAPGAFAWTFRQPAATLVDDDGRPLGIHGRGPFWAAYDGSRVVGATQANAPGRDPTQDVPLLLLRATTEGDGRFAPVTYIQRLDTRGGVAPPGACDPQQEPEVAVPYLAVYYFYGVRS